MGDAPTKHYRLAPSSAFRWTICPYSAMEDLPESAHHTAATGTDVHKLAAGLLNGEAIPIEVNDKVRRHVEQYYAHVAANRADEIFVEHQWVSQTIDEFGGTTDAALFKESDDGKLCAIYDYKNGRWPVDVEANPQLLSYATIIQEHYPEITAFYGVIIQPNSKDYNREKVAAYSLDQIKEHRERVIWAADSDHIQTGEHCRFCAVRRIGLCDEGAAYAAEKGWK